MRKGFVRIEDLLECEVMRNQKLGVDPAGARSAVSFMIAWTALPSALLITGVAPKRFAVSSRLSSRSTTMILAGE